MSMSDDDAEILATARAGFIDEAQDMLRQFEEAMLALEDAPEDAEQLNAAFRAAHTIKGTAGLFGFDRVVTFTHEAETLLEALRSGQRPFDEPTAAALLESRDQIERLLSEVHLDASEPQTEATGAALAVRLRALYGGSAPPAEPAADSAPAITSQDAAEPVVVEPVWHLSIRFLNDALRNGLDPLSFMRYLSKLGEVRHIRTLTTAIPALESIDAEACYLGFEVRFKTEVGKEEIAGVFEFATDDSDVQILAPDAKPSEFEALAELRCGIDAVARAALYDCWLAQGHHFDLREDVIELPGDSEPVALVMPRIERRTEAPVVAGANRRSGEGDRREGGRDRRAGDETRFIRVRADKLDHLIDLIGELVIAGSGAQMLAHQEGTDVLMEATRRVVDLMQDTRDGALALRMVPIGETFGRFQRVVRDISKQLGKEVDLVVSGGDTELDKSMVERLADPLMHLVRNSMDHGLEAAADRLAAGKPVQGRLALNAFHEAGAVVIEVSDDGRGLARERIVTKAIERELINPTQELTDHEVWQLIFLPGFSTAEQVTDLSGRGVGMDVVKRNIESLRGTIALTSEPGRGTLTQIRLPLTLAMIDGFLTMVSGAHYVLPLSVVAECIDVPAEHRKDDQRVSGTFNLRGEVLPWLDLARFYQVEPDFSRRRSVVVVRYGDERVGLIVDRLMGQHQTVIKPLPEIFAHVRALAGSTILGSGDVALVLDVQGLMRSAQTTRHGTRMARRA
ncbi:chemotaxis protein CheA [Roseateles koreensis]|uniref:Chemotaxis protein CheA n=1 Tax=Roseateles koreensis TaxID=2987526 RepID=A0ABT5KU51_9BURK|nr:chemotaxis protein CheA [Roseateles koreensis]MDC8785965.1 chemotaxis protein CheA [Roseateles koreensis]